MSFFKKRLSQRNYFIYLSLLLFAPSAFSQVQSIRHDSKVIGVGTSQPKLELDLIGPNKESIRYQPNTDLFLKFDLYLGGIGIGFGIKNEKGDEEIFGETSYTDYQFRFSFNKLQLEAFYQRYRGYFIENSSEVDSSYLGSDLHILMPNMQTSKFNIQSIYTFNDNFSLQHAFGLSEIQETSAGSFLLMVGASSFNWENNGERLVPSSADNSYGLADDVISLKTMSFKLGPGVAYTYIFKGFYISAAVFLTPNLQKRELEFANSNEAKTKVEVDGSYKFAFGWNYPSWKLSFQVQSDDVSVKLSDRSELRGTTFESLAQFAYRF